MAGRLPGSAGVGGTPSMGPHTTGTTATPGPNRGKLTKEQTDLAFDIVQFALDIAGIFEPTPFCDGANALISLARGDIVGAALSGVSMIPYIGDLAKAGKLPKYVTSFAKAIKIAGNDAQFAAYLRPALARLKQVLDKIPMEALHGDMANYITFIRRHIDTFMTVKKAASVYDTLSGPIKIAFKQAASLPLIKNPRAIAKHHGPVIELDLVREITGKGFVKVKEGTHGMAGTIENSDVYMRRVVKDGEQHFECVRVDRRATNPNLDRSKRFTDKGQPVPSAGTLQGQDKASRRIHHTLNAPEVPSSGRIAEQLNSGKAFKGDFTHWHHESFPVSDENLARYLTPPVPGQPFRPVSGLTKYDPAGFEVR